MRISDWSSDVCSSDLMICIGWLGVFVAREFWPLAAVLLAYGFFQNAILAQFEAVTMAHLGSRRERYSQVRVWGSLGFIVTVTGLGLAFDHYDVALLPTSEELCVGKGCVCTCRV